MAYKMRVRQARIKSEFPDRSGLVTENMTSATADKVVGTTFKNVLVDENGEFVVGSEAGGANNGLDVDGTNVVLGQDVGEAGNPAALLSNREIPMAGNNIELEASNGDRTLFDGTSGYLEVGRGRVYSGNTTKSVSKFEAVTTFSDASIEAITQGNDAIASFQLYDIANNENNTIIKMTKDTTTGISHTGIGNNDNNFYIGGGNLGNITGVLGLPPTLSTATTETLAIDTATGQIGRSAYMTPLDITTVPGLSIPVALGVYTINSTTITLTKQTALSIYMGTSLNNSTLTNTSSQANFSQRINVNGVDYYGGTEGYIENKTGYGFATISSNGVANVVLPAGIHTITSNIYIGGTNGFGGTVDTYFSNIKILFL